MYSNEHTTQMGFYKRSCQFSSFSLFLPVQQLLSVLKLLLNNMKVHCFSFHLDCFRRKTFWFLYIFFDLLLILRANCFVSLACAIYYCKMILWEKLHKKTDKDCTQIERIPNRVKAHLRNCFVGINNKNTA